MSDTPTTQELQGLGYSLSVSTDTILEEIDDKANKRKDIAKLYRHLMCGVNWRDHDWPVINRAIIKRWSMSGLIYIKRLAWQGSRNE